MPGLAKSNEFMLGTATVMIGPVEDLYDLNPTDHSIGLVKNFVATSEPSYTELTQGVKNTIVFSVMTANPVRCTMEAYEYTAANLLYALGLDGSSTPAQTVETAVNGAVDGGSPQATDFDVDSATGLTIGDTIMIIQGDDDFIIRTITNVAGSTITVDNALPDIADNSVVKKVTPVDIGSKDEQPFFAAKIAGKFASGEEAVVLIPKIRITKGFNLSFVSDNYGNLPLEFTVYDLVPTDTFYEDFGGAQARLYRK